MMSSFALENRQKSTYNELTQKDESQGNDVDAGISLFTITAVGIET